MLIIRKKRSYTIILIFKDIGIKEAIFISTASAKPAATDRVGKIEKAKYNLKSCSYKVEYSRNKPIPKYYVLYKEGLKAKKSIASKGKG